MSDGWVAAGSVLTGVSAAFIGWQAWLTQRLVRSTQDDVSNARQLAVEAIKTRLDSRGPNVTVSVTSTDQVPHAWSDYGDPQPWPAGAPVTSPGHDDLRFAIHVTVVIRNDGDRTAFVTTGRELLPWFGDSPEPRVWEQPKPIKHKLSARSEMRFLWWAAQPFWCWAENTKDTVQHVPTAHVEVDDHQDEGVKDYWQVSVMGAPFAQNPTVAGQWRVLLASTAGPLLSGEATHTGRDYFRSKVRNERLM